MHQVDRQRAAEDALLQRLDHFAALDQRFHRHAVLRLAIVLGHDQVLGDVNQPSRQIP
jgi:hypothetical protein